MGCKIVIAKKTVKNIDLEKVGEVHNKQLECTCNRSPSEADAMQSLFPFAIFPVALATLLERAHCAAATQNGQTAQRKGDGQVQRSLTSV